MHTTKRSIKLEQIVQAPVSLVYRAFTNSTALREWMGDYSTMDPRPGGRLYIWWHSGYYTSGEFIRLEPNKELVFTWHGRGEPRPTQVTVTLKPKRDKTLVRLVHRGFGTGKAWQNTSEVFTTEWSSSLQNLASVLGSGPDLRVTTRPMIGINISDFNAEIAQRLGIPVSVGIRLDGVVDGMGAQTAGLQKDDVLVEFAGYQLLDFSSLSTALTGKKAGDTIPVVPYRGAEKITTNLTLSGRPIPVIPPNPVDLSTEVGKAYTEIESQMAGFLRGVSEHEATFKPAPGEWSIKEVIVHLIHGERGWQNAISDIAGGQEASYDGYYGNLDARNQATLKAFPSLTELESEWKRLNTETVALLAYLPEELLQRKGSYWRLAYQCLNFPAHFFTHLEQMQAALQAARKI